MATNYLLSCVTVGGRPFSVSGFLVTDAAAGVYMNLDMNKPAVATSPTDVIIPAPSRIIDIVANNAAAPGAAPLLGEIEIVVGGKGVGVFIPVRSRGGDNAGRMPLNIPLRAGSQLRLQVVTAINDV